MTPSELDGQWNPEADERLSAWEVTVRLAGVMSAQGVDAVAQLLAEARAHVNLDVVKELGFLLFHEAEKKNLAKDALLFNSLVSA